MCNSCSTTRTQKQRVLSREVLFGGTCLNVGCIPSKSLLHSAEMFHKANKEFDKIGITTNGLSLDVSKMMSHKLKTVDGLTKGIEFLFKKIKLHT